MDDLDYDEYDDPGPSLTANVTSDDSVGKNATLPDLPWAAFNRLVKVNDSAAFLVRNKTALARKIQVHCL
jgi:hypothetical protein